MYSFLKSIAIILTVVGAFSLLGHFSGQFREGSASDFSLIGGLVLLIPGLVLLVLADLGVRLVRIETKLGTLPEDDSLEE